MTFCNIQPTFMCWSLVMEGKHENTRETRFHLWEVQPEWDAFFGISLPKRIQRKAIWETNSAHQVLSKVVYQANIKKTLNMIKQKKTHATLCWESVLQWYFISATRPCTWRILLSTMEYHHQITQFKCWQPKHLGILVGTIILNYQLFHKPWTKTKKQQTLARIYPSAPHAPINCCHVASFNISCNFSSRSAGFTSVVSIPVSLPSWSGKSHEKAKGKGYFNGENEFGKTGNIYINIYVYIIYIVCSTLLLLLLSSSSSSSNVCFKT